MKKSIILILFAISLAGYSQISPGFKALRYEEDYSYLKKDTAGSWYNKTKYQPLPENKNSYISTGGDIRYQYLFLKNEDWGDSPRDKDGFLLTRYLVHTDFHAGKYFRAFIQLQSSLVNGKQDTPSPVDQNPLDLHQAFFDVMIPLKEQQRVTVRIGRQEMLYGSQRLVAVRDGPNNRQSFDAAKIIYTKKGLKADVFFSHYVRSRPNIFDDGFNKNTKFWGTYLTVNNLPLVKNIDLYYFGLWKKQAAFDDGTGRELRHSIGSRIWGNKNNFRYDAEALYQFGKFNISAISAWTASINTGYKFSHTKLKPELGLKTELISGDAVSGDGKLQTFNPLFPRGGYFGLVSLIGPSNLFDVHPSLSFEPANKLLLNTDCDIFWRYSKRDGIYGPNAAIIYSGKTSNEKYIGQQYSADLVYTPNTFLYFRCELTFFKAGDFLKDVSSGKNILFAAVTAQLKF